VSFVDTRYPRLKLSDADEKVNTISKQPDIMDTQHPVNFRPWVPRIWALSDPCWN
jgi:hypothetical protein